MESLAIASKHASRVTASSTVRNLLHRQKRTADHRVSRSVCSVVGLGATFWESAIAYTHTDVPHKRRYPKPI